MHPHPDLAVLRHRIGNFCLSGAARYRIEKPHGDFARLFLQKEFFTALIKGNNHPGSATGSMPVALVVIRTRAPVDRLRHFFQIFHAVYLQGYDPPFQAGKQDGKVPPMDP